MLLLRRKPQLKEKKVDKSCKKELEAGQSTSLKDFVQELDC
jgi:hypothetical protein